MIGIIIQARMNSTRLPGKVLMKLDELTVLDYVINQIKSTTRYDKMIIATTNYSDDDKIIDHLTNNDVEIFRGESENVLDRYYQCAKKYNFPIIVRITSDNPLIDPEIVDQVIESFKISNCDYMSTEYPKTFPLGFAVEVFTFRSLEMAWNEAKLPSEREHVTPYIWGRPNLFNLYNYKNSIDFSYLRWTIDTYLDLKMAKRIYRELYLENKMFYFEDIIRIIKKRQDIVRINSNIKQKLVKN